MTHTTTLRRRIFAGSALSVLVISAGFVSAQTEADEAPASTTEQVNPCVYDDDVAVVVQQDVPGYDFRAGDVYCLHVDILTDAPTPADVGP